MINIGMHHKVIYKELRHDKEAISKNSIIENTYEQIYTATIIQINNGKLQPKTISVLQGHYLRKYGHIHGGFNMFVCG